MRSTSATLAPTLFRLGSVGVTLGLLVLLQAPKILGLY